MKESNKIKKEIQKQFYFCSSFLWNYIVNSDVLVQASSTSFIKDQIENILVFVKCTASVLILNSVLKCKNSHRQYVNE